MALWRHVALAAVMLAASPTHAQTVPPRLSGTVVARGAGVAIFSTADGQTEVEAGDQIGIFTVIRVRPGQVELIGPQGRVVVSPVPSITGLTVPPAPTPPPQTDANSDK